MGDLIIFSPEGKTLTVSQKAYNHIYKEAGFTLEAPIRQLTLEEAPLQNQGGDVQKDDKPKLKRKRG